MTGLKGRIPFVVLWIICIIAVDAAPFFYPKGADPNVPGSAFQLENLAPYLQYFGYHTRDTDDSSAGATQEALENLQKFAGLEVTGRLDGETINLLRTQRCGKDDADALKALLEQGKRRKKRYYLQGSTWKKSDLTYRFISFTEDIPEDKVRQIIKRSLNMWSAASTLTIREEADPTVDDDDVDILISFVRGYHFDSYPFDGTGGTLAHAYYPHNNLGISGDAHFDDDEPFTTGTESGINLDWVAVHEFGHSVGLAHSSVRESIMYPWYKGYFENIALSDDDIQGIQAMYGAPLPTTSTPVVVQSTTLEATTPEESSVPPSPTTATTTPPTPTTKPPGVDICKLNNWDAAFERGPDGRVYVVSSSYFWVLNKDLRVELGPLNISSRWEGLPESIDEAYTRNDGKTVFFSAKQYWIYNRDDSLFLGPKPISDYGLPSYVDKVDAAFVYPANRKAYLFWQGKYWRYDEGTETMSRGYPRSISVWGAGLATGPSTVMAWPRNGRTYFFYGPYYYRILADLSVGPNYPKKTSIAWAACKI